MPNEKIVVVESQSLREEAKMECKNFVMACVQEAKAPVKRIATSAVERGINWILDRIDEHFAA